MPPFCSSVSPSSSGDSSSMSRMTYCLAAHLKVRPEWRTTGVSVLGHWRGKACSLSSIFHSCPCGRAGDRGAQ